MSYETEYQQSVTEPDAYWAKRAEGLHWRTPFEQVSDWSFDEKNVHISWFLGGQLNVAENCIDCHLPEKANNTAIIFEPDNPDEPPQHITYAALHRHVCRAANMLLDVGVKAGDRVTIYMPMIPEAAYAMLACARIGAIHSVVFGGFSPEALRGRIIDCASDIVITADEGMRGNKAIPLKANVDEAVKDTSVKTVITVKRTGGDIAWHDRRDMWWHEGIADASEHHEPQAFESEQPLFILYTSGSTGTPKGLLHSSAGYLLYAMDTFKRVFDYKDGEVYWCTADVGWITGHSYILYGPLAAGATTLMFEGVPNYPDASRFWQVVDKHKVASFYTAPTAIRMLMREGDEFVQRTKRDSLRILGTVGEPINPEAWRWYNDVVGENKCSIVDTWWQTETGGHLITPLPDTPNKKPGAAMNPFFGIQPALIDEQQNELTGEGEAALCMASSWPAQARTIWGNHKRFIETYFTAYKGYYFSGDAAARDAEGHYWIRGRMDDVLNVSGHRLGTAEIESALVAHEAVTEAAVVGFPHDIKGEGIYAYVTLKPDMVEDAALTKTLIAWVRREIGPIATPDRLHFSPALPKTRSGKIMRRILRKIAAGEIATQADYEKLGDISTLLNPESVDSLVAGYKAAA